jgi:hypothetical protein
VGGGNHALAFWFTATVTLPRDTCGRHFLRLKAEEELLRAVDSRLFLFQLLEEEKE